MSSIVGQPHFEPTDIFDFGSPPPSPPSAPRDNPKAPPPIPADPEDEDMFDADAELAMMEEEELQSRQRYADSPPPPMDEEPEWDIEDEIARQEAESLATGLAVKSPPSGQAGNSNGTGASQSGGLSFGRSDILDFPAAASSSRVTLPPTTSIYDTLPSLLPPEPCYLPPLFAETAMGSMVKFKRRSKPKAPPPVNEIETTEFGTSSLLGEPLHHLLAEVQEIKSREMAVKLQKRYDDEQSRNKKTGPISTVMWVDKYRPKKFSDLLGEERVHRDVMGWLKEWDKCVFKRANPPKKRRFDEQENMPVDPLGRPRERILLLAGPPGFGKTTLAHVVARQAGYKTLEINASDDRSAATVSTRIKNAIEAGSGLASDGKPTCVVIDEIDGASGGGDASFVKSLLKLIQDVPARRKTNTPAKPLRRPIICICNDLYATSLRPLRPFARVIRFRKPQSQFLVKRLREICDRELLSADMRTLTTLVEVTTGDVRSCLNTLQFIKSKSSAVTPEAIKSSAVGLKDSGTTLQTVWNSLFIPVSAKVRRKTQGIDDGKYVNRLVDSVSSCGEYDRLVQGLFEHYPNLKPLDASLGNVCNTLDWLAYYDRLFGKVNENQEFELMAYIPFAVVPWHSHLAAPANATKPTEWPKADYECFQTRTVNEEVATTFKNAVPPSIRSLFPTSTTLTELIPMLMRIITPPLRPVNANVVKSGEKAVLGRLVDLLIPLGLHFWQEKNDSGQPMMRLEPPIDVFVHYEGKRAEDIAASRFAVRQMIAQAMSVEVARRKGSGETAAASSLSSLTSETITGTDARSLQGAYAAAQNGSAKGRTDLGDAEVIATDFFGRKKVPRSVADDRDTTLAIGTDLDVFNAPSKRRKFRAVYKFNEGSSSAVRKTIKMGALM